MKNLLKIISIFYMLFSFTYANKFYKLYFEWKTEATIKEKYDNEAKLKLFLKRYLKVYNLTYFPTSLSIPFKDAFFNNYIYIFVSPDNIKILSPGADGFPKTKDDIIHNFFLDAL